MNKAMFPFAIALGVVLLLIFGSGACLVSRYNSLVSQEEAIAGRWAQVENVLQRRADLIPNLVSTVQGYASHEREIFTRVAEARAELLAARGPAEAAEANQGLNSALGRLLAISENYPQLKADGSFQRLQDELAGTENRIAVERMRYNEAVQEFNTSIRRFPNSLLAGLFGFDAKEYFEADATAREVPQVSFD
jgi:LemA protein